MTITSLVVHEPTPYSRPFHSGLKLALRREGAHVLTNNGVSAWSSNQHVQFYQHNKHGQKPGIKTLAQAANQQLVLTDEKDSTHEEDSEEDEEITTITRHGETISRKKKTRMTGRKRRLASIVENVDISHLIVEVLILFQEKRS